MKINGKPPKWSDAPLYEQNTPREETGYQNKPKIPWADEVLKSRSQKKPSIDADHLAVTEIINLGAIVCKKLKNIFPEKNWFQIAEIFSKLKKIVNVGLEGLNQKEKLLKISKFSEDDLKDILII